MLPFGDGEKKHRADAIRPVGFYAWPDRDVLVVVGICCPMNFPVTENPVEKLDNRKGRYTTFHPSIKLQNQGQSRNRNQSDLYNTAKNHLNMIE